MASSKIVTVVAYPSTTKDGQPARFDMDYYLKTHMGELIERDWRPFGMRKWTVESFPSELSLTGQTPPYIAAATIEWDNIDDFKNALTKGSEASAKDVANYTNVTPEIIIGKVTGSSAA
ncbi:hypothetical protein AYO21_06748 [Fonsecaea monophora]|uniref:EthD domain-containing protein n=1 Tax=Fonsecaea monophora TaxID=254056 RepID=A0A177F469_9EURO|nr:hypothetical protein AYO21_06748 [Fonsecaea monophora]KAH0829769.1 hypothetical protein FOPE_10823 [Fonsecaea pedrosoi]OAG39028.1 hypothetical protein AYO21_06748 [Fonsecaea monophora]